MLHLENNHIVVHVVFVGWPSGGGGPPNHVSQLQFARVDDVADEPHIVGVNGAVDEFRIDDSISVDLEIGELMGNQGFLRVLVDGLVRFTIVAVAVGAVAFVVYVATAFLFGVAHETGLDISGHIVLQPGAVVVVGERINVGGLLGAEAIEVAPAVPGFATADRAGPLATPIHSAACAINFVPGQFAIATDLAQTFVDVVAVESQRAKHHHTQNQKQFHDDWR